MSTFNSAGTVAKSIESITNQTYKNLELLIVDDNSSDDTFNIIKRYSELNENIFAFKNELNIGLTKSLNFLIHKSKGELIARQDDDDISYPGRIKKQVDELERNGLDFCTTRALTNPTKKKIPGVSYYLPVEQLLKFNSQISRPLSVSLGSASLRHVQSASHFLVSERALGRLASNAINGPRRLGLFRRSSETSRH